nr:hypothetical protein [Tanacetum cinerariifolium]
EWEKESPYDSLVLRKPFPPLLWSPLEALKALGVRNVWCDLWLFIRPFIAWLIVRLINWLIVRPIAATLRKGKDCWILMAKVVGSLKKDLGEMWEVVVVMVEKGGSIAERGEGDEGGVENKSLIGSKFKANGEECLDGCVGAGGGEVKGGGVDFRVVIEDDREVTPIKGCRNNKDEHES